MTRDDHDTCVMCNGIGSYVSLPGDQVSECPYCSEKDPDAWRETAGPPCPVCWHSKTMRCREYGGEPQDTTPAEHMEWHPPYGGARGQQVTRWDDGAWGCPGCGLRLTRQDAVVLLDAVLHHSGLSEPMIEDFVGKARRI